MVQMASDLVPLLDGAARGTLDRAAPPVFDGAAVCVVLASGGYPRSFEKGRAIEGLGAVADDDVIVFHAGTVRGPQGGFVTSGGRVLGVTARGEGVAEARERAYAVAGRIHFQDMHYRRDIAGRALAL
jgi:phosphoribosylamine--glycine ligase